MQLLRFGSLLFLLTAVAANAQMPRSYTYFQTESFLGGKPVADNWKINGNWSQEPDTGLVSIVPDQGFSLISRKPVPSRYEVAVTLHLTTSGGIYDIYLDASPDALIGEHGTYHAVEIANPHFTKEGCTAQAQLLESVAGASSVLTSLAIPCHQDVTYHALRTRDGEFILYADGVQLASIAVPTSLAGQPGIGGRDIPAGNAITELQVGSLSARRPRFTTPQGINSAATPTSIHIYWRGADNEGGVGIAGYRVSRNGTYLGDTPKPEYLDKGLSPSTSYEYSIVPFDLHHQYGPTLAFSASTKSLVETSTNLICPPGGCGGGGGGGGGTCIPYSYSTAYNCNDYLKYRPVGPPAPALANHSYIYQTWWSYTEEPP